MHLFVVKFLACWEHSRWNVKLCMFEDVWIEILKSMKLFVILKINIKSNKHRHCSTVYRLNKCKSELLE